MNCLWCHNPEDISTSDNWCYWCNRYSNNWNLENILSNHAHVFDFKTLEDIDSFVFSKCLNPVRSENCVYKEKLRALPYAEYLDNKDMREKSKYLHSKDFKDLCSWVLSACKFLILIPDALNLASAGLPFTSSRVQPS